MLKLAISSKCQLPFCCKHGYFYRWVFYIVFALLPSSCEAGCNENNKRDSPEPRLCLKVIVIKVVLI